jgi:hypothetical protein
MTRPTLETREHFAKNPVHRLAVLTWLVDYGPKARKRRAEERRLAKIDDRLYVEYGSDPEFLLDGYNGKLSPSPFILQRDIEYRP